MFFNRLLKTPETSVVNRVPEQCVECLSADITRMHLTRLDKKGGMQRRYQCRACDHHILVKHCEMPEESNECQNALEPSDLEAGFDETSEYERKIASLES